MAAQEIRVSIDQAKIEMLIRAFQKSPVVVKRNLRRAMKISLSSIAEHAKMNHKFISRSGALENSVMTRIDNALELSGRVYLDQAQAAYAPYVHGGTGLYGPKGEAYAITPKNGKWLRWANPAGTGFVFAKKVMHLGQHPDEFLYQAAEAKRMSINATFNRIIDLSVKEVWGE